MLRAARPVLSKNLGIDRQHVCFCGCPDGKHFARRQFSSFHEKLNINDAADLIPADYKKADQVALWKESSGKDSSLILASSDEIEKYVLSMVRSYFRTTKKASVSLDSSFADHGLDSLDVIELVIQVEDELNYLIDAEKLELFSKPKHFVNFITQMEAYKQEHNRLPHEGIYEDFATDKAFPGLPSLGH